MMHSADFATDDRPGNMPADIPAEIVRKVAEAMTGWPLDECGDEDRDAWLTTARAALTVAAPLVAAQALREAADAFRHEGRGVMFNRAGDDLLPAGRVGKWLRERADKITREAS